MCGTSLAVLTSRRPPSRSSWSRVRRWVCRSGDPRLGRSDVTPQLAKSQPWLYFPRTYGRSALPLLRLHSDESDRMARPNARAEDAGCDPYVRRLEADPKDADI